MATEIQTAQNIWPQLASIVFVPRTESDHQQLSALRDELIILIGESENHPLVSLMEVVETLIEKYESEQETMEREAWHNLSIPMLERAYGEDEPEYTTDMLKWVNPDYEGK
jgi:HTH-type transcriptional regulator/antitoxin HigA